MKHHGPSNGHDGLDVPLGDCIVMMGTSSSKMNHSLKLCKLRVELLGSKRRSIVSEKRLDDDPQVVRQQLVLLLGLQGFIMGSQVRLEFNIKDLWSKDTHHGKEISTKSRLNGRLVRLHMNLLHTGWCPDNQV